MNGGKKKSERTLDFLCDVDQTVASFVGFVVKWEGSVEENEGQATQGPDVHRCRVILSFHNLWRLVVFKKNFFNLFMERGAFVWKEGGRKRYHVFLGADRGFCWKLSKSLCQPKVTDLDDPPTFLREHEVFNFQIAVGNSVLVQVLDSS